MASSRVNLLARFTPLLSLIVLLLPLIVTSSPLTKAPQPSDIKGVKADDGPQLIASLDYGTFRGAYSRQYNISYWQKIPFAAPPVGQNRFRGPQPPVNLTALDGNAVYDSSQPFDMCPQRTVNGSEDCLYLGLYSRPWKPGQPLRPVVVVFYGGGFIRGSASFSTLPPSAYPVLNVSSSTTDLLFIYPNYRTNAFGLLAGQAIVSDPHSDTNAGLLDQRAAIRWANRHAAAFGGDPRNVSIWGQSAGGGSVLAQVIGNQSFDDAPGSSIAPVTFQKALASSPYWPKTYAATSPEAEWIYHTLVNRTGCASSTPNTLACLKAAPVQAIRDASEYIAASHAYTTSSYTFAPVIDGPGGFLSRSLTEVVFQGGGGVNSVFNMATYNTHEGENFLPPDGLGTEAGFEGWVRGFLPGLTGEDLDELGRVYPVREGEGRQVRAGMVYRDVVLACPGFWMAGGGGRGGGEGARGGGWLVEYTISPAKHASEVYWWNTVNSAQQTEPLIYKGFTGAFASFFMTGDPNARKLTPQQVPGVPEIGTGEEFVVGSSEFGTAKTTQLRERCDFWRKVAPRIPI